MKIIKSNEIQKVGISYAVYVDEDIITTTSTHISKEVRVKRATHLRGVEPRSSPILLGFPRYSVAYSRGSSRSLRSLGACYARFSLLSSPILVF